MVRILSCNNMAMQWSLALGVAFLRLAVSHPVVGLGILSVSIDKSPTYLGLANRDGSVNLHAVGRIVGGAQL